MYALSISCGVSLLKMINQCGSAVPLEVKDALERLYDMTEKKVDELVHNHTSVNLKNKVTGEKSVKNVGKVPKRGIFLRKFELFVGENAFPLFKNRGVAGRQARVLGQLSCGRMEMEKK